ncbi:hypothetical protein HYH02_012712 [Chlamydomonas schloesseri]|uniref:Dienelactone hydrolase domain-containing protein n=1 Tax=Chlamydomonas schloesseri TaxID=2026947 RepID=A0A835W134_9CHLO|nr:hypothetical protein HYH02_012712 [Chlamydomonas schloesseri]|eukprot:KAG2433169.1 hypothetical protein HYH02_012712 [Chlamydomonas schloesseri]
MPEEYRPFTPAYTPRGKVVKAGGGTDVYRVRTGQCGVVVIPDIFGLGSTQLYQLYDRLAECGLSVAAVDVFHGKPWSLDKFPPKPEYGYGKWLHDCELSSYDKAKPAVMACMELLHGQGAMRVCCVGVGHGAAPALAAGQVGGAPPQDDKLTTAVGCINPAGGTNALFEAAVKLKVPLGVVFGKGEVEPHHTQAALSKRPFGKLCVFKQVGGDKMLGRFCTASANWADPLVAAAAGQAAGTIGYFLITAYQST